MARNLKKTLQRSSVIAVIRKITSSRIILSQKTSNSLGNFYAGDYK